MVEIGQLMLTENFRLDSFSLMVNYLVRTKVLVGVPRMFYVALDAIWT